MSAHILNFHRPSPDEPGTLPPLDVTAQVTAILNVASTLLKSDHVIVGYHGEASSARPSLWLKDCSRLRNMARVGRASYDRQGQDEKGPYRVGLFELDGVTCCWIERRPSCAA